MRLHKSRINLYIKDNIQWSEEKVYRVEENPCNLKSDRGLIFRIHKELKIQRSGKWGKQRALSSLGRWREIKTEEGG